MKKISFIFFTIFLISSISFSSPKIQFTELLTRTEENPELVMNAKREAIRNNLPVSIVTTDHVMVTAMSVENGMPVYSVITNFADLYDGGYTAFYNEVVSKINFSNAKIDYGNGRVVDNTNGYFQPVLKDLTSTKVLMIPESGRDGVLIFDSFSGDLIDSNFVPPSPDQLSTPIHALMVEGGNSILVSDQIDDVVQEFDQNGIYKNIFAPAGGVNNDILNNIRGMAYRPNGNLLVTVASGLSTNTVQEFDNAGNPLGAFMSSGMTGPFAILYRSNDILVACSSGPNDVARFDLSGNFLSAFQSSTSLNFAEQMIRLDNGDIVVAGFSSPSGLVILDSTGVYKRTLNVVTGNRGVYLLGNGHYLTTSGTSVYELDSATGGIIRTIITGSGFSFRFISEYIIADPTFRLTVNLESCPLQQVFNVELRNSSSPYGLVDSQSVIAGASIPVSVSFPSASNGTGYYIVVKGKTL